MPERIGTEELLGADSPAVTNNPNGDLRQKLLEILTQQPNTEEIDPRFKFRGSSGGEKAGFILSALADLAKANDRRRGRRTSPSNSIQQFLQRRLQTDLLNRQQENQALAGQQSAARDLLSEENRKDAITRSAQAKRDKAIDDAEANEAKRLQDITDAEEAEIRRNRIRSQNKLKEFFGSSVFDMTDRELADKEKQLGDSMRAAASAESAREEDESGEDKVATRAENKRQDARLAKIQRTLLTILTDRQNNAFTKGFGRPADMSPAEIEQSLMDKASADNLSTERQDQLREFIREHFARDVGAFLGEIPRVK